MNIPVTDDGIRTGRRVTSDELAIHVLAIVVDVTIVVDEDKVFDCCVIRYQPGVFSTLVDII